VSNRSCCDLRIVIKPVERIIQPIIEENNIDGLYWSRNQCFQQNSFFLKRTRTERVRSILNVNFDFNEALLQHVIPLEKSSTTMMYNLNEDSLFRVLFRFKVLFHQGIVLHSSAIKYHDQAILFTAPSGTGKTTMGHLWKQHKDAVILNGESPAIRMIGDHPVVFGTPWSGSKPEFVNDSAPLKAIVVLEQAPENKIRKLDAYEYLSRVLPRVYLPYFDESLMNRALKNFEMIVESVPVYLLQCRPDQEAVELVHQCLF
jgi:hypothetical protein